MWAKGRGRGACVKISVRPGPGSQWSWGGGQQGQHTAWQGRGALTIAPSSWVGSGGLFWAPLQASVDPPTVAAGGAPVLPLMEQKPFSELCPRGQFDPARPRPNCFPLSFTKGHVVIFLTTLLWKEEKFQRVYLENWSVNKVAFHLQRRTVNLTGVGLLLLVGFFKK